MNEGEGERPCDPFPEVSHIYSDCCFVSGECPLPPPFSAAAEHSLAWSPTLQAASASLSQARLLQLQHLCPYAGGPGR